MNYFKLETLYENFASFAEQEYGIPFQGMSHPYFETREGYKDNVWSDANRILDYKEWQTQDIGSGKIQEKIIKAIELRENNLVQWQLRYGEDSRSHNKIKAASGERIKELEIILYKLYKNAKDEEVFDDLVEKPDKVNTLVRSKMNT